ncbi:FAD-binding protein [Tessaracoccus sp. OS52]|uniref:FAD-binding protein n=1 Tax=Tessaracoccus sp. OS52 TaxID=2886691 RepID=UPI001D11A989|nr:FAD-binding protein [Tessaracoccus sp. OS52]MCC2594039.1 FAD-binding protein [Tessaracoccus sp. OS52]
MAEANLDHVTIGDERVPVVTTTSLVIGTGSAGYCAAERLAGFGAPDVVMVADKIRAGASRNAGSDKQTYYKLTLSGSEPDSVRSMAETLFSGGSMDGDNALAEAALSARCFYHLIEAGVPFPANHSGEFVGYKTDHDPRQRATSVGPFTSKSMVESLESRVRTLGIPVIGNCRLLDLIVDDGEIRGALFLRTDVGASRNPAHEEEPVETNVGEVPAPEPKGTLIEQLAQETSRFLLVRATNVVQATGGPAGMYADSVYPHGQWGGAGAALRNGARGHNLTEWQFGMASIKPRWNVSGTYMQVVPRFVSTDVDGGDEREFLADVVADPNQLASLVFLKGYQWPFDIRKARDGSSLIDLLVYRETVMRGRRVFLDFRSNPVGDLDPAQLDEQARVYLERAEVADLANTTPIQRLRHMNEPSYQFYLGRNPGVDLETDMLEIAVCAQHNNGGVAVDHWWHSSVIDGLFPVGEAAGAHGVYRPGGAALNSGQVGATRAAQYITAHRAQEPRAEDFDAVAAPSLERAGRMLADAVARFTAGAEDNTGTLLTDVTTLMSRNAGLVRSRASVLEALKQVTQWLADYEQLIVVDDASRRSVNRLFLIHDILTSQYVYLHAMKDYLDHGGRSRGSVLYTDAEGDLPWPDQDLGLPEEFRFVLDGGALDGVTQEVDWDGDGEPSFTWRDVRPIPSDDDFFENVWRNFRTDRGVPSRDGVR